MVVLTVIVHGSRREVQLCALRFATTPPTSGFYGCYFDFFFLLLFGYLNNLNMCPVFFIFLSR